MTRSVTDLQDAVRARDLCAVLAPTDEPCPRCEAIAEALSDTRKAERVRLAGLLAAQPASQATADVADVLGLSAELDAAWDALHPEDAGKTRGYAQQKGAE